MRTHRPSRKASFIATCFLVAALLLAMGIVPAAAEAAPVMQSVTPTQGQAGDTVYVRGWNFGETPSPTQSKVFFNGVAVPYPDTLNWTDTVIIVLVPDGATTGPVVVTTINGSSNTDVTFTVTVKPVINNLLPDSGPVGTGVLITGTSFGDEGDVTFNNVTAETSTWTNTAIVTSVPDGATTGPVVVTTDLGA
ncbi:MAG: IPT/TIG domain-containing protein, partial [Actinobacteria bacterium]|nr:IPT/TIG domain-containing protein [Actinomycetota bacterium]